MLFSSAVCPDPDAELLLNEYLDGEIDPTREPELFSHLATCADCRRQFESMLAFRLAVRQEALPVPPALDRRVMSRLDTARRRVSRHADRRADRAPLAGALHHRISVGAALAVAVLAIGLAALMPVTEAAPSTPTDSVRLARVILEDGPIYVIDQDITVEAQREGGL